MSREVSKWVVERDGRKVNRTTFFVRAVYRVLEWVGAKELGMFLGIFIKLAIDLVVFALPGS